MAGTADDPASVQSTYPLPPLTLFSQYTDDHVRNGSAPKPPRPMADSYSMFGMTCHVDDTIIRPLESQGIHRLYPNNYSHHKELKKLNHSILVNFLDLLDVLIKSPGAQKREEKLEDINLLFIHMHHLINEFRPHQARETLRVMMTVQKAQRMETSERLQKHIERCQELLKECIDSLPRDISDLAASLSDKMEFDDKQPSKQNDESESGSDRDQFMCDLVDGLE